MSEHNSNHTNEPLVAQCFPVEMHLKAGKIYSWCTCGHSKNLALCDGEHKKLAYEENGETIMPFRSLKYQPEQDETVWFCQCKQTKTPPFCDGSHNAEEVKAKFEAQPKSE